MTRMRSWPALACSVMLASTLILSCISIVDANSDEAAKLTKNKQGDKIIPKTFDYGEYVERYRKNYTPVETLEKARYFFSRTLGIFKHNVLYVSDKVGHFLKQSEYTDMTPREMNQTFKLDSTGLEPVKEAQENPELAADQLASVAMFRSTSDAEGLSMSAAVEVPRESRKPVVNFMQDEADDDQGSLVELMKQNLNKKELAQLMSLSSKPPEEDLSEQSRKIQGIKYNPVVEGNNKHFDPNVLPSRGVLDSMEQFGENYAKMMMDDFTADLTPYPQAKAPSRRVLTGEDKVKPASKLGSLLNSVKTVFEYLSYDDYFGTDDFDNDGEFPRIDDKTIQPLDDKPVQAVNGPKTTPESYKPGLDYDVDWRRSGCISRPRSQGSCNSCYAFAVLDLMEFFYCYQKKSYTEFSVQYVVDCGAKANLNGCEGGKLSRVGMFIKKYGIQLESYYPYRGVQDTCPFDDADYAKKQPYPLMPELKGWRVFQEMAAWHKWLPKSPVIVGINMPGDFLAYGGGIHDGSDCVPGMVHAMLLVGSGTQDGQPFWLIKNTFSDTWGEEGYFRLSKKAPLKCFNSVVVARVNFDVEAS